MCLASNRPDDIVVVLCVAPLIHFSNKSLLASDTITGFMYFAMFERIISCLYACLCVDFLLFHAYVLHIYTMYALLVDNIHGGVLDRLRSGK